MSSALGVDTTIEELELEGRLGTLLSLLTIIIPSSSAFDVQVEEKFGEVSVGELGEEVAVA